MIRNLTRGTVLAEKPKLALAFAWRCRGMIGRRFDGFDALVFPRCWSIHTAFMGMPLDVVFLDRAGTVLRVCEALAPWRLASALTAATVIELPAGRLRTVPVRVADRLLIEI